MLTAYLDESLEQDDGIAVVAGFVGMDIHWDKCVSQWSSTLAKYGRSSLHLADLRLGRNGRHAKC